MPNKYKRVRERILSAIAAQLDEAGETPGEDPVAGAVDDILREEFPGMEDAP